jgi:hypothetical protein
MNRKTAERILNKGSIKEKTILYLTDSALFNLDSEHAIIDEKTGDIIGSKLLSPEERETLYRSINISKNIQAYERMRKLNSVFMFFKERLDKEVDLLLMYYLVIANHYNTYKASESYFNILSSLLKLYPDSNTTEIDKILKQLNIAPDYVDLKAPIRLTNGDLVENINKNSFNYLQYKEGSFNIEIEYYFINILEVVNSAINTAIDCKRTILVFKEILYKDLPIKPYKDYTEIKENHIKGLIDKIRLLSVELKGYPIEYPIIDSYDKLKAEITEEDVNDFKSSVL